jgi:ABC-type sugar transport system ATPase subunit
MAMSAADNVVLSDFRSCSRGGILATKSIRKHASDAVNLFGFPVSRLEQRVDTFSGGNQQKLLMGRWLHSRPRVLLADEPTRGIDIGAKAELLEALRTMAAEGVGVAIASSELEETVTTSDRVLVLSAGRATASLDDREQISLSSILHAAFNTEEAA